MSQRERMLGRRIPPTPVVIRVDFGPDADEAFAAHEAALRDLNFAESRGADLDAARDRVAETKDNLDPFQEVLYVSALPPAVYDELIGEHPPTDEQRTRNYQWDPQTFAPALLAACIGQELPDEERMSEKDWTDWASISSATVNGEFVTLVNTCLAVNDRAINVNVGKG